MTQSAKLAQGRALTVELATPTQTIDLNESWPPTFSDSGSFNLGDFELSSYGRLLHSMPLPAMLIDPACAIIFANEACGKIWANVDLAHGSSLMALLPEQRENTKVRKTIKQVFADKQPRVIEAVVEIRGIRIWARMHWRAMRSGKKRLALLLMEDLTAEKRELLLTRRQEERLRQARDELEQRVTRRTAELVLMNERLQKEVAERETAQTELRKAHDELEKRVEERTRELLMSNENLKQEILARRQVEVALRESEEKYRAIVENIEEGYYEVDLFGQFTFMNDSACKILRYGKQQLLHENFWDMVVKHNEARFLAEFATVLTTGKPVAAYHCVLKGKDGIERDVELSIGLIRDSWNKPVGFRGFCRDITNIRREDEERRRLEKLESVGVLAGGIAHDFNNILTALLGNIALAGEFAGGDERAAPYLAEAEKACVRAQALTRQLLTFSNGGAPIKKTIMLDDLVRSCCEFALTGSRVRCEFAFPDKLSPVEADEGQISQVFSNLIINANQAMPKGGMVRVFAQNVRLENGHGLPLPHGKYVRISVMDQGCGIPADKLGKIFDPYFTTKPNGSGLGLATCYSIVKNHQGRISVQSKPGLGTVFHVYLPASESPVQEQNVSGPKTTKGQGRILLMDDEEAIRQIGTEVLSLLGYEAEVASDGAEAVHMYAKAKETGRPFDAVIMDLTVPGGMGGYEATQMLRQIDPNVKAIVSSGYSEHPIMSEYETHGFCGIIKKPYTHRELGEALNGAISRASQRSSNAEVESRCKAIPLRKRSEFQEMSRTA